ncbi:MAG TPA: GMC family oxidoreductase, partial [Chloroflexota bacterium]|nr:GMC family oxidoreductase [Chloroflexota bacterium]
DPADVLVIGAGASGGALTWRLSSAGVKVVCLEQGGWIAPETLPAYESTWELRRLGDFNADPNVRGRPEDYPVANSESPIAPLMFNAVGGSTIHWSGHFPRLHPSDFHVRTLDEVGDDWPLTYADLEPFYELNDREIGVAGLAGDPAYPPRSRRSTPPIPIGSFGTAIGRGFDRLGWHWWVADTGAISKDGTDGRLGCNLCGPCDLGCPRRAQSSANVTYWPKAIRLGAKLITGARVREVSVDGDGRVSGAIYYDTDGKLAEQRAAVVVLACNGIGTPRLMLNSRSSLFPDGLANRSGLVGKNLMFHPVAVVSGVVPEALDSSIGPIGSSLYSHEFYETSEKRGFVRGYMLQAVRQSGPLNTALGGIGGFRVTWGRDHHRSFAERDGHLINLGVMGEDLPEEHNQVTLDPLLTDSHGIPAPKVTYRLSDNSSRMLDHGVARAGEVLEAAGATKILVNPLIRASGWHLLGTARMGIDPDRSVVNVWGQTHDIENLFIVDGSIFTTSGGVNPTSTIQALALRTADYLVRHCRTAI